MEWMGLEDEAMRRCGAMKALSLQVRRIVVNFVHSALQDWRSPGVFFFEVLKLIDAARDVFGETLSATEAIARAGAVCLCVAKTEVVDGPPLQAALQRLVATATLHSSELGDDQVSSKNILDRELRIAKAFALSFAAPSVASWCICLLRRLANLLPDRDVLPLGGVVDQVGKWGTTCMRRCPSTPEDPPRYFAAGLCWLAMIASGLVECSNAKPEAMDLKQWDEAVAQVLDHAQIGPMWWTVADEAVMMKKKGQLEMLNSNQPPLTAWQRVTEIMAVMEQATLLTSVEIERGALLVVAFLPCEDTVESHCTAMK